MTQERRFEGYEPRFDLDYEFGKQGELWVQNIVQAMGTDRIEIKHDAMFERTGNVYVEFRCQRKGAWLPSGICTTDAELWVFVLHNGSSCVVVSTEALKMACRYLWRNPTNHVSCDKGSHPTKGLKVSLTWLLQHGTRLGKESA